VMRERQTTCGSKRAVLLLWGTWRCRLRFWALGDEARVNGSGTIDAAIIVGEKIY
jgi:hypothetical protein